MTKTPTIGSVLGLNKQPTRRELEEIEENLRVAHEKNGVLIDANDNIAWELQESFGAVDHLTDKVDELQGTLTEARGKMTELRDDVEEILGSPRSAEDKVALLEKILEEKWWPKSLTNPGESARVST